MSKSMKWETRGEIAILTLSRPEAMNSFDLEMMKEHRKRLEKFEADDDLRVLIYIGEGRAFSTGIDIKKAPDFLHWKADDRHRTWVTPCSMEITKPTIAAVNGFAYGGGCELALGCDFRIAAKSARFGLPEVLLGAIPGGGGTQLLPRLIGLGDALLLMLTGEAIDADEALRLRMVQKVVPDDQLLDAAVTLATAICRGGKHAVPMIKKAATKGLNRPIAKALWLEQVYFKRNRDASIDEIEERLAAYQGRGKKNGKDKK